MFNILFIIISVIIILYLLAAACGLCFKLTNVKCTSKRRLEGKTCLVTGGTSGMGLEIATEFARRGAKVIIACPFQEEGTNARTTIIQNTGNREIFFKLLDLSSLSSTRKFSEDILSTEERLDILVNNAGVLLPDKLTADGMNFIMQVNYFGHFLLTILLLPLLKRTGTPSEPSRIVNTSSFGHVAGDIDFERMNTTGYKFAIRIYFDSKLCIAMFTRELAKRLIGSKVVVNTADPGVAVTAICDFYLRSISFLKLILTKFYPSPWEGAQTAMHLALDQNAGGLSGEYFKNSQLSRAGSNVYDDTISQRLWEKSVKLVKLSNKEL